MTYVPRISRMMNVREAGGVRLVLVSVMTGWMFTVLSGTEGIAVRTSEALAIPTASLIKVAGKTVAKPKTTSHVKPKADEIPHVREEESGSGLHPSHARSAKHSNEDDMTEDKAYALAEAFGVEVGAVDEEIKDILGLTKAEGVVVFAVIGNTPADRAGIKVKAVIKEVDGEEIRNLLELGRALEKAMPTQNFSVATFEAAGIDDQGVSGGLNFHFVRVAKD